MYFVYKTKYSFGEGVYDKKIQSLGSFFIHDTGEYENKVCAFGKVMAIVAIFFGILRVYLFYLCKRDECIQSILTWSVAFEVVCCSMAYLMNLNALFYILPIAFVEVYILYTIRN